MLFPLYCKPFWDLFKIMWGMEFFLTSCYDELLHADLSKQITDVEVPLYLFLHNK
ncbi:MAG: hypothetical protein P4L42_12285 [Desulfocapsaceae bacterium]|nr:hypothetical protein [Desulfocapsaceae bacterium]